MARHPPVGHLLLYMHSGWDSPECRFYSAMIRAVPSSPGKSAVYIPTWLSRCLRDESLIFFFPYTLLIDTPSYFI